MDLSEKNVILAMRRAYVFQRLSRFLDFDLGRHGMYNVLGYDGCSSLRRVQTS